MGSKKKGSSDKNSEEYREKRMKNNNAVKRSRDKTKQKAQEASDRVQKLQVENEHLRSTVDIMTQELKYLKEMLISQAGTSEYLSAGTEADLEALLREDAPTDLDKITTVLTEMRRIQSIHQREEQSGMAHHVGQDYQPNGNMYDGGHGHIMHY